MGLVLLGALIMFFGILIGAALVKSTYKEILNRPDQPD